MPKETTPVGVIFDIVTSTETTTALSARLGIHYKKVASLRRSKKYESWKHLRRAPHNQEVWNG